MMSTLLDPPAVSLLGRVADGLDPRPDPYAADAAGWAQVRLGEWWWSKQHEIAESVHANRYTAVHSAHGLSKSHTASRMIANWIETHPVGDAFAVSTAPTDNQVGAILWRELGRAHRKGDLQGRITLDNKWYIGRELVAYGRKPADYVDAEQAKTAFQGIHAKFVLVVLDEAAGIPGWLWEAVDGLATNPNARVLAIGNPDDPSSEFARRCEEDNAWNTIHISAFDSPQYIGLPEYTGTPEMEAHDRECPEEVMEQLTGPTWVDERKDDWGEDSNLYVSKVLGLFPVSTTDTLIHSSWLDQAVRRDLPGVGIGNYACDVARSGDDESVVGRLRDGVFRVEFAKAGLDDTMILADEVYGRLDRHKGGTYAVIDIIGLGAGVYDRLAELDMRVIGFGAGEKADRPDRYVNKRAEQWWRVRKLFKNGELDIDGKDKKLYEQLKQMRWFIDKNRIAIEKKEDMAKRGVSSPDRADTLMMATVEGGITNWPAESELAEEEGDLTGDLLNMRM